MIWEDVKKVYPYQWVIIEAIEAHTAGDKRIIENMTVVDTFYEDNNKALLEYVKLHRKHREREMYVVHTSRSELDILEQKWIGVRADIGAMDYGFDMHGIIGFSFLKSSQVLINLDKMVVE